MESDPTAAFFIAATPDAVWQALLAAYGDMKVPVTELATEQRRAGNPAFRTRRQLGGVRLSRYLNCGERLGDQNADSYEVTLRLQTQAVADGSGTTLHTLVDGTAKPVGVSGAAVNCSTTGELERRVVALVRAHVPSER